MLWTRAPTTSRGRARPQNQEIMITQLYSCLDTKYIFFTWTRRRSCDVGKSLICFSKQRKRRICFASSFTSFRRCLDRTTRTTEVIGRRILHIDLDATYELPYYVLYYLPCRASSHFFREQDTCCERTEMSDSESLQLIAHQRSNSISPIQHSLKASEKSVETCHFSLDIHFWDQVHTLDPQIWYEENSQKMVCPKNL